MLNYNPDFNIKILIKQKSEFPIDHISTIENKFILILDNIVKIIDFEKYRI